MLGGTASRQESVLRIDENGKTPKFQQIVNGIIAQIEAGIFKPGDRLPSINETSAEYYLARATVEKAYCILLKSGHITSLYRRGFFISQGKIVKRVLFLTGTISETNRAIFKAVSDQLGKSFKVDIYAYEYQRDYLLDGLEKQAGNYHYFVLMPHHLGEICDLTDLLKKIPSDRLIFLDGSSTTTIRNCASVRFGCREHFRTILEANVAAFRKYQTLNFVTTDNEYIPADWYSAFLEFTEAHHLNGQVLDDVRETPLQRGSAYLLVDDEDLITTIQETTRQGLRMGQDVGMVSFHDAGYKAVLGGGISVIKTDILSIGRNLAHVLKNNQKQTVRIPMQFIDRGSL
ncbi:GntR family transcriptional regulator [Larkinella rosea]|uniref:GntR family transcriptional regulator n=1 Tax=Larkinella rosea TaxID=2025312 RepID=A0A3P1BSF4_9BACT|nr:GntR family transcriptional regulator [Larkinella rosea]RRB03977.1 GntR family transcriptional regulator [Larkinella rosea]